MVIYDVKQGGTYSVYDERSVPARLGQGLNETGFLGDDAIARTIHGLQLFRDVMRFEAVRHVVPIATSAAREAANRSAFVEEIFRQTDFKLRILSGKEEALYSYAGAISSTARSDVLFFDLGGGSLEIVSSKEGRTRKIMSLPLGGLRLTEFYSSRGGAFTAKDLAKMRKRIFQVLPDRRQLGMDRKAVLLGVGGTLRALARFHQELNEYPLNKIHNYEMEKESIKYALTELSEMKPEQIGSIDSIGEDRSRTIVAGTMVVDSIMSKIGFEELVVSTHGLRDGVLQEYIGNALAYESLSINGRNRRGHQSLLWKAPVTFEFTEDLLEAIISHGLIDEKDQVILVHALGQLLVKPVDYGAEALFYMIIDEDSTLSHRDEVLAALTVVRARKPRVADWLFSKYKSMLPSKSKNRIKKLSALSEMFEILERTRTRIAIAPPKAGGGRKIEIRLLPEGEDFPIVLFKSVTRKVGEILDYSIECVLSKVVASGQSPRMPHRRAE